MDALLVKNYSDTETQPNSLRLANDVRAFSTVPTAHVRDLVADGIQGNGLAVYFAIADRQVDKDGEYFRSNKSLAEETGLKERTVQRCVSKLRKKQYLSVWYINGGRRMRISTKVSPATPQHATSDTPTRHQRHPYKENNIKKTTQTKNACVSSISLSKKQASSFGEKDIQKLVASFGLERVERGLLAWDAADQATIRTPIKWLTSAIKEDYEPRTATTAGQKFTESVFDHMRIVQEYRAESQENAVRVDDLIADGLQESRIAYKIWAGLL